MAFALTDGRILAIYCLKIFANNFLSTSPKDMIIVRLDAPRQGDSNEL